MNSLERLLIGPSATLHDAMVAVDAGGIRIVIVVDEARQVLGTLTDGDIRRALLRQLSMDTLCSEIMTRSPETASVHASKDEILKRMESRRLIQMPLVDDYGRIAGVQTLHDLIYPQRKNNIVFLMAGGFGTRLQPLTDNCPKPLLNVGDKPILEIIIQNFVNAGFYRFYISTHYRPEMIREKIGDGSRWGVEVQYIYEEYPLGTAGAISLLPKERIDEPFIMMNGDLLTNLDFNKLLEFHDAQKGFATMCVREYEHRVPYGVIESVGFRVAAIKEKPAYSFFINAGIYVLSPDVLSVVPSGQKLDMPTLLEQRIDLNDVINIFPIYEYWLDIGRMEDFQRAQYDIGGLS
jgi:dTDP-glucose pyrophosphorylase